MSLPYAQNTKLLGKYRIGLLPVMTPSCEGGSHEGSIGVRSKMPRQMRAFKMPRPRSCLNGYHPHTRVLSLKPYAAFAR